MMESISISNGFNIDDSDDNSIDGGNAFESKLQNTTKESSEWIYSNTCGSRLNSHFVYRILCDRYFDKVYSRGELRKMVNKECKPFRLPEDFVNSYRDKQPPFGFGGLGEATFYRTYSRRVPCGEGAFRREAYYEVIKRVVEGCFTMQKRHIYANGDHWNDDIATKKAKDMYERLFLMKFTPPGRGLWAMGTKITEEEGLYGALNSCAFFSTENIAVEKSYPFAFLMDNSMIGIGVGMDVNGAGTLQVHRPSAEHGVVDFIIGDTREGWVSSTVALLESYFNPDMPVMRFDYSKIRPKGLPLVTFGGIAPGPEPLEHLHKQLAGILEKEIEERTLKGVIHDDDDDGAACFLSERNIADIANMIGACVVSGNVRRSAEILFGPPGSTEFMDLKDYVKNPERGSFGWISNNSIFATLGMDYTSVAERAWKNGEPGLMWLENTDQGRLTGLPADMARKDPRIKGGNPCLEQSLENTEICNLCETMIDSHDSLEDFLRTLKCCVMYCKTVSLGTLHHKTSNAVMCKNRRYGVSLTGIKQFVAKMSKEELFHWCDTGYETVQYYDRVYASWFNIPKSIKTTSIKPSGSVSLLAGKTPGVHAPVKSTYVRRITIEKSDNVLGPLREAGYPIIEASHDKNACLVEFPIKLDHGTGGRLKTQEEESLIEQLEFASWMQRHWADNQVSVTINFFQADVTPEDIANALNVYQYKLKGVSFMPMGSIDQYKNPPYQSISDEEYYERAAALKPIDWSPITAPSTKAFIINDVAQPRYCLNDSCEF